MSCRRRARFSATKLVLLANRALDEGYKDAAAVVIGSVLEDRLRKLAESNGIAIRKPNGKPLTIEPLNVECAKSGVYDRLVQKQVTSWGDLR